MRESSELNPLFLLHLDSGCHVRYDLSPVRPVAEMQILPDHHFYPSVPVITRKRRGKWLAHLVVIRMCRFATWIFSPFVLPQNNALPFSLFT